MVDKIFNMDCMEGLKRLPNESVNLVLTDPPYNVNKAEWDHWKTVDEYIEWCGEWIKEVERVLSPTGTFIFFHNDMEQISRLMEWIRVNTCFSFNSFCIWNKGDFRALAWKNPTEENNLRCWFNVCEYFLVYVKNGTEWGEDKTGLQRVKLDVNNFATLRKYAYDMLVFIGSRERERERERTDQRYPLNISKRCLDIGEQSISSTVARRSIFSEVGGKADHFMRYGSTQWELCTEDTYKELTDKFNLREWAGYKEYEALRQEYEALRYVHNLDPNHKNIFTSMQRNSGALHPTEKPTDILSRLVKTHSREGDVVLDLFCGSHSTIIACMNTYRHFIGFELDKYYHEWGAERIAKLLASRGVKNVEDWYKRREV